MGGGQSIRKFGSGASFFCSLLAKARAQGSATTLADTDASALVQKIWETAHVEVKLVYAHALIFQGISFAFTLSAKHRRELTCRQLSGAPSYSCYAVRFASSLPDWNSTATDAVPASLPFDLPEQQSQAPTDFAVLAHTTSPAQDGPVGAVVGLIDGLHSVTGLPWWATLSVTALGKADASTRTELQQDQLHCLFCREQHIKLALICRCPCSFVPACCASDTSKCRSSTSTETGMVYQQTCLDPSSTNGSPCKLIH